MDVIQNCHFVAYRVLKPSKILHHSFKDRAQYSNIKPNSGHWQAKILQQQPVKILAAIYPITRKIRHYEKHPI